MKKLLVLLLVFIFLCNLNVVKCKGINKIKVDIKGAVVNPGVYEIDSNSRVMDLILASGGLRIDADTSYLNLSKQLFDEDVIIIYTTYEIKEMINGDTSIKIIEKECVCPKIDNSACIKNVIVNVKSNLININTASLEDLMTLPGIGESKANSIIEYRKTNTFNKIEDLINVKGFGEKMFEKIKNNITT